MSENNMAVIQFLGYRLVNIHYNCAPEFEFPEGDVAYNFNFSKSNMLLSSNDFQENLEVNVFYSQDGDIVLVKHFCNTYGLFFQLDCYSSLPEVLPKIKGGPLLCNKPLTWVRIS